MESQQTPEVDSVPMSLLVRTYLEQEGLELEDDEFLIVSGFSVESKGHVEFRCDTPGRSWSLDDVEFDIKKK